jgi:hypothetical protein
LRIINRGGGEYRLNWSSIFFSLRQGTATASEPHEALLNMHTTAMELSDMGVDLDRTSSAEARRRILAVRQPVPPHSTVDMLAVCTLASSDEAAFEPTRIATLKLGLDLDRLDLRPNFTRTGESRSSP